MDIVNVFFVELAITMAIKNQHIKEFDRFIKVDLKKLVKDGEMARAIYDDAFAWNYVIGSREWHRRHTVLNALFELI
jgi:hypothetical protein